MTQHTKVTMSAKNTAAKNTAEGNHPKKQDEPTQHNQPTIADGKLRVVIANTAPHSTTPSLIEKVENKIEEYVTRAEEYVTHVKKNHLETPWAQNTAAEKRMDAYVHENEKHPIQNVRSLLKVEGQVVVDSHAHGVTALIGQKIATPGR